MLFDFKTFLKTLTSKAGVYQMMDASNKVLYVGKARNLKKRVASYFRNSLSIKTASLVAQVHHVEVIVTRTENEALLLESNLIKKLKPRYNILLRDDKSYPYIVLTDHADYPRLEFYRGPRVGKGRYFGPYFNTRAVRETLQLLQKIFRIRTCQDDFFRNRKRPCMQYQIKRCTAPCVGLVEPAVYQQDVQHAILFLQGKSQAIVEELARRMESAAIQLNYEEAARYRDQIAYLRQVQQQQAVVNGMGNSDVIALSSSSGSICVQVISIRSGQLLGSKAFFPVVPADFNSEEVLAAFLSQYYLAADREIPLTIILSGPVIDQEWIATTLSEQARHKIKIITHPRGSHLRWLQIARQNVEQSLLQHLAKHSTLHQRFSALQEIVGLDSAPQRLECFDVSHSHGEATVASCVVFDQQGSVKNSYRRFNIENIVKGDDYAALQQALLRHYGKLKKENATLPDILIIDGGKGQLKQAEKVFEELQITEVIILAIAKGSTRKPGLEQVFISGQNTPLPLSSDSSALHLIQQIRDEAHRFAITGHRGQRAKTRHTSVLESIPGIGAKRRQELLRQFGGLQELRRASSEDIAKVPGINKELAERIYEVLQKI